MPATPIRRRRPVVLGITVVLSLVLLAGCSGQREPGSYTDGVEKSFNEGCWEQKVLDGDDGLAKELLTDEGLEIGDDELEPLIEKGADAEVIGAAKSYCQCAYDAIKDDVSFGDFKKTTDELRDDNGPLPASFQKAYAGCEG